RRVAQLLGTPLELGEQDRLPDARLASDRDHPARRTSGGRKRAIERLKLAIPADDLKRACSHSGIPPMVRRHRRRQPSRMPLNPWLGVEFRHLAALDAIARTGSFRGGADALGYVQSAVSQQVARLEALVGMRLIDRERGTGPVQLTAAGELMLKHTNEIMQRFDAAQADLGAIAEGRAGTLRVGTCDTVARSLMPGVLSACGRRSEVQVMPVEVVAEADVFERVANGALDVAFATLPLEIGPFAYVAVCDDPCVLVVPAESPLAARTEPLPTAELAHVPLIRQTRWRLMPLVEAQLRAAGVDADFVMEVAT